MSSRKRIGILGAGTIARSLIEAFARSSDVEIAFVLTRTARNDGPHHGLSRDIYLTQADEAFARPVDLVVEAALPEVSQALAPRFLTTTDFCAFSSTALADESFERAVTEACRQSGRRFFVPHGAVLALDGIADGRDAIRSLTITTMKGGRSLGLAPDADGIIFEGATREACRRFPRNVNVHAALAVAGLGFDRTQSRVVAVPGSTVMEHHIAVEGDGLNWQFRISSTSLGGVTGSYTPRSAVGSVKRILGGSGLQVA